MALLQKNLWPGILSSALSLGSFTVNATNGYFAHGYGARSKAMAGTGVAFSQDAVAGALNPAGLAYVGNRLDLEVELFSPIRQYTVQGGPTPSSVFPLNSGTYTSESDIFAIPTVGWSHQLDNQQSLGVVLYGNGGMNTDYNSFANPLCPKGSSGTGTFCAGNTGIDLSQAFIVRVMPIHLRRAVILWESRQYWRPRLLKRMGSAVLGDFPVIPSMFPIPRVIILLGPVSGWVLRLSYCREYAWVPRIKVVFI
jgi:hypothetical protein